MNDEQTVLNEQWYEAEYIDEENKYVKVKYRKVETYRLFLRFISEWFHPCQKCQQKIKNILENTELHISTEKATVHFLQLIKDNKIYYAFGFPFVKSTWLFTWKPCQKCQAILAKTLKEAHSLIIGNDKYEHPVELSKQLGDDDESFETLETHKATEQEKQRIGEKWIYKEL